MRILLRNKAENKLPTLGARLLVFHVAVLSSLYPALLFETPSQRISGGMETTKKLLQFYVAERPLFIAIRPLDAAQSTHIYRLLFRAQTYRLLASCWIPPKNSRV
jgi:hypothetical protein